MKRLLMLGSGSSNATLTIRLRGLAKHLAADWDVRMILPRADKYNNFRYNPEAKVEGVTLVQPWQFTTHSPLLNLLPYLFTSLGAMLRAQADVVYLYKPTPITVLGLLLRLRRTPVMLDLDDLGSEVMKLEGQSRLNVTLVSLCERLSLRFSSAVIVASTALEAMVRQRYPHKPILVLPNGAEPADYKPVKQGVLRHSVYFFGGINRLAMIEDLLRAVPRIIKVVPDAHITIAGGGAALDDARQLVAQLGVDHAVTFTGWLTDMRSIQQYVQFGDIGVCYQPDTPTVRAASNMKVFQYMAMRSVPVVSDVGDLRAYVQDGKAGVVAKPGDAEALARVIIELLQDEPRRKHLANHAYQLATHDYSWRQRAADVTAFARSLEAKK